MIIFERRKDDSNKELMDCNYDRQKMELLVMEQLSKFDPIARKYLSTKKRTEYYLFSGVVEQVDDGVPEVKTALIPLTNREIERIKQLVEAHSGGVSFEQVCRNERLFELRGKDAELDRLVFDRCAWQEPSMRLCGIDVVNKHYLYAMTAGKFDLKQEKMEDVRQGYVDLTDEEYIYLLKMILLSGSTFQYWCLYDKRPDLARKMIEHLYGCFEDAEKGGFEYRTRFDEVFANAKEIYQLQDWYMNDESIKTSIFF